MIQSVCDTFAILTKALDQTGRFGAFHHTIQRKAVASDTGLDNLREVQAKVLYLPLSGKGVFGSRLQENLKKRKEWQEKLSDLVPKFAENKTDLAKVSLLIITDLLGVNRHVWLLIHHQRGLTDPDSIHNLLQDFMMTGNMTTKGRISKNHPVLFGSLLTLENDSNVNIGLQSPEIPVGGGLRFFFQNWKKITDDQWVLSVIKASYKLEFIQKPHQRGIKQTSVPNQDINLLKLKVEELL